MSTVERARSMPQRGGGISANTFRIALITAEPLYREGMQQALRQTKSLILLDATTIAEVIELAKSRLADLVVIEANSISSALQSLKTLKGVCPELPAVTVSDLATATEVQTAFEAGARACVLKRVQTCEFFRVLESIHLGGFYVPPELGVRLFRTNLQPSNGFSKLTRREVQILSCVARGLINKEVARELQICEKTVKHYMTAIMEKLQVRNRVEAALKMQAKT